MTDLTPNNLTASALSMSEPCLKFCGREFSQLFGTVRHWTPYLRRTTTFDLRGVILCRGSQRHAQTLREQRMYRSQLDQRLRASKLAFAAAR